MKVWRAITKTLGCLSCVSNPEASPVQLPPDPPGASSTQPVLEEPAPAGTPVDSPESDTTDEGESESPAGGWQDFKKTAKGALQIILKIAKEASAVFPPAQGAIRAAGAAIEVFDVSTRQTGSEIYNLTAFSDRNIAQIKTHSTSSTDAFAPCYK